MNCDHFIGFTLDTRHEEFIQYYVSDNVEDVNAISYKFDYYPECGEKIDWKENKHYEKL